MIDRALKAAVARACSESTRAVELLAALAGHRVAVIARGTPFAILLEATATDLRCQWLDGTATAAGTATATGTATAADATISGTPLSLMALTASDPQAVIARGDVRIDGDSAIAQQFRELLLLLRPDLEHALSGVIGRSAAHLMLRGLRGAADWSRATAWTSVQNVSEYLAHERGDLVSRAEAEHFLRGVDQLREQLDRLAARTDQLERKTR